MVLKVSLPALRVSSNRMDSYVVTVIPSLTALVIAISVSRAFLELMQSVTNTGSYPASFKSIHVCSTQICASIPQTMTVFLPI